MGLVPKKKKPSLQIKKLAGLHSGGREDRFWLRASSVAVPIVLLAYAQLCVRSKPQLQCMIGSKYWQCALDKVLLSNIFFFFFIEILIGRYQVAQWYQWEQICTGKFEQTEGFKVVALALRTLALVVLQTC